MQKVIKQHTEVLGNDHIIYYGSLSNENPDLDTTKFINEIQKYEIYNLPLEKHQKLITDKWNHFVEKVKQTEGIFILENCFLQNPITITFGRYNEPRERIINYVKKLEKQLKSLEPKLIYFYQNDVEETIRRVMKERTKEWLDHGIYYFTEQGYGKENGLIGVDGFIKVLSERKSLELEILEKLEIDSLAIDNTSFEWESILKKVEDYVIKVD